ncbi:hypothetical protein L1887_24798 [Cichorium endivia]|nr:hypothetical protein L1887_24798 [Cichorium endivia]
MSEGENVGWWGLIDKDHLWVIGWRSKTGLSSHKCSEILHIFKDKSFSLSCIHGTLHHGPGGGAATIPPFHIHGTNYILIKKKEKQKRSLWKDVCEFSKWKTESQFQKFYHYMKCRRGSQHVLTACGDDISLGTCHQLGTIVCDDSFALLRRNVMGILYNFSL